MNSDFDALKREKRLHFESQKLTSFAGLFLFQVLFQRLELKRRLQLSLITKSDVEKRAAGAG